MKKVWIITEVGFDNLENRHPWTYTKVAAVFSPEAADREIAKRELELKFYKGWDDKTYPYFTAQAVPLLEHA